MSAILVTVSSGHGPVEVRRFVALLAAEIERELAAEGRVVARVAVHGDGAAPRSVDLEVNGGAGGIAIGTHVLCCHATARGKRSRRRWFASVFVTLLDDRGTQGGIDLSQVAIRACRAGGPGGQHVNKTSSAVRVTHRPTGITVRAETERSQHANRELALERLGRALATLATERERAARGDRRSACLRFERGRPVASWVIVDGRLRRAEDNGDGRSSLVPVVRGSHA
jgi:peptide chain release factor 2/peptide chain release factor